VQSFFADSVVIVHFLFILFVLCCGILTFRQRHWAWLHLPAVAWGVYVELSGRICPLTPLENLLRYDVPQSGYQEGFINHYLVPLIYPEGLTREIQIFLGLFLLAVNILIYAALFLGGQKKNASR